jgi:hypothetical protein
MAGCYEKGFYKMPRNYWLLKNNSRPLRLLVGDNDDNGDDNNINNNNSMDLSLSWESAKIYRTRGFIIVYTRAIYWSSLS